MFRRKPKDKSMVSVNESVKPVTRSRINYIALNDGQRIGLAMEHERIIKILENTYGMSPESAVQLATDINKVFHSGSL